MVEFSAFLVISGQFSVIGFQIGIIKKAARLEAYISIHMQDTCATVAIQVSHFLISIPHSAFHIPHSQRRRRFHLTPFGYLPAYAYNNLFQRYFFFRVADRPFNGVP